jgi:hypothetical protein
MSAPGEVPGKMESANGLRRCSIVRITRIVTVIEIVEDDPRPLSVRETLTVPGPASLVAAAREGARSLGAERSLGAARPAGRVGPPALAVGSAAVGALSATAAIVGREEVRRRLALGARRVRAALGALATPSGPGRLAMRPGVPPPPALPPRTGTAAPGVNGS